MASFADQSAIALRNAKLFETAGPRWAGKPRGSPQRTRN
jgi:hypothetical protein